MKSPTSTALHSIAISTTLLGLAACTTMPQGSAFAPAGDSARIVRTTHGIPNVTASSLDMLRYGTAYAFALLLYGQIITPGSPHQADQPRMYVDEHWPK